jgi:hypothetical protein
MYNLYREINACKRAQRGKKLFDFLMKACADFDFGLFILNPAFAFLEGSVSDASSVSDFLRIQLQEFLRAKNAGGIVVHHTPKPPKSGKGRPHTGPHHYRPTSRLQLSRVEPHPITSLRASPVSLINIVLKTVAISAADLQFQVRERPFDIALLKHHQLIAWRRLGLFYFHFRGERTAALLG